MLSLTFQDGLDKVRNQLPSVIADFSINSENHRAMVLKWQEYADSRLL